MRSATAERWDEVPHVCIWHGKRLPPFDLALHLTIAAEAPINQVHLQAEQIKRALLGAYPALEALTIHTEPPESPGQASTSG
jgi:divalent metal cation (Fe/Co/Zn/Cd) transporter